MTPFITVSGLGKSFRGRAAVSDISFEIARGEIFGLLGHNGAGKSTTFGMMLGLVQPNAGTVTIGGHLVATSRSLALARTGAIFESPAFYDYLSGRQNLEFFVSLGGSRPDSARIGEIVRLVGLSGRIEDSVRTYSHGMRQRLGLAQALLPDPDFILLDEPTDGLDPLGIREMRALILRLRDEFGLTVLLSSHLLSEVEHLCDRVAILHEGKMVFCGHWSSGYQLWEFEADPEPGTVLESFGLMRSGHAWKADGAFDPADAVAALVASGHRVRRAAPRRLSLEEFYINRIGGI